MITQKQLLRFSSLILMLLITGCSTIPTLPKTSTPVISQKEEDRMLVEYNKIKQDNKKYYDELKEKMVKDYENHQKYVIKRDAQWLEFAKRYIEPYKYVDETDSYMSEIHIYNITFFNYGLFYGAVDSIVH